MSTLDLLAFALTAATLGGMLYFVAGVAPVLFKVLSGPDAGRFVRALFKIYYVFFAVSSALAAVFAGMGGRLTEAALLAVIAAGFVVARQGLMPRINALRDRVLAGEHGVEPAFKALHRSSVFLNLFQMIGLVLVAWMLAR